MSIIKKVLYGIVGLVSSILGIVCFTMDTGSYEMNLQYGGDAYTGIQNASAQAANNVQDLAAICAFGFGALLLIIGLILIVYAITSKEPVEYVYRFKEIENRLCNIQNAVEKCQPVIDDEAENDNKEIN